MKIVYYIRPSIPNGVVGPVFGPFQNYVILENDVLITGTDGGAIAYRGADQTWHFSAEYRIGNKMIKLPITNQAHTCPDFTKAKFTGIVIWGAEEGKIV